MPRSAVYLKVGSISIMVILILSMVAITGSMAAPKSLVSSEAKATSPPQSFSRTQENGEGTYVDWYVDQDSTEDSWSYTSSNWAFGPSLSFEVFHENGTRFKENHYALIDEKLNFSVTVPKSIFPKGKEMGFLMFYGQAISSYASGMTNATLFIMGYAPGESNLTIIMNQMYPYPETVRFMDWATEADPWYALGNTFNYTMLAETGQYAGTEMLDDFLPLYGDECTNTTDEHNNYYNFIASFEDQAPRSFYQIGMFVLDQDFNMISQYYYGSGYDVSGLAVGVHPTDAYRYSYGGTYTMQKLDLDGNVLYSVNREEDFRLQFNISEVPQYVEVGIGVPDHISVKVNRTGWHWGVVEEEGGWVYDEVQDTYIWNSTAEVFYEDSIYGEYQEYEDVGVADEIMVEVRSAFWNDTSQSIEIETSYEPAYIRYRLVYNDTTGTFETRYGYGYSSYPYPTYVEGVDSEYIWVDVAIPDDPLYVLNEGLCSAQLIGGEFVVEIVGHFTEYMPVTEGDSYKGFEIDVRGENNRGFGHDQRQSSIEFEMAQRITIESPVTIAKILLETGEEFEGYGFQMDKDQRFQVLGRLQGGASSASEISAVKFNLRSWDSKWSLDEDIWSDLNYEITVNMDGVSQIRAFNYTEKQNWTYGIYDDWVKVLTTGWHWEYNATSGKEELMFGDYYEWERIEVEGWHPEYWHYNQKTGKWQREWTDYRSSETEVTIDFLNVTDFSWWIEEGDLYAQFFVYVNYTAPDAEYYWEFAFASDQWYYDEASAYGEHDVLSWDKEWVFSFEDPDHPGQDVYNTPVETKSAYYNDTLCLIEGVEYFLGEERPYIVIGDEVLPINVREYFDPYSLYTYTDILFYDYKNYTTNHEYYYYELTNGTKISITYDYKINIYNVTIVNGSSFLTAQYYPYEYFYNDTTLLRFWVDLDGGMYIGDWSEVHDVSVELHATIEPYAPREYFVIYGENKTLDLAEDFRWDSRQDTYLMIDSDSNLYVLNYTGEYYEAFIEGSWQQVSYPYRYYMGNYSGTDVFLLTSDRRQSWYFEKGEVRHEMPYPGADARYWYHVGQMESDGGKVPTTKSIVFLDKGYTVYEDLGLYYVDIGATTFEMELYYLDHTIANDTEVWDPLHVGYSASVGLFDDKLAFNPIEKVEFESSWTDYNATGDYYYLTLRNGTYWMVNESFYTVLVYEYDLDGKVFHSIHEYPDYHEDEYGWTYYYEAINGTWFNMTDWEMLPVLATYMAEAYDNGTEWVLNFQTVEYLWNFNGHYTDVLKVLNASYGSVLYIPYDNDYGGGFRNIYQFMYHGWLVNATASLQNVLRLKTVWGDELVYGPQPIESALYKNIEYLIIGIPEWGMWGEGQWTTNPDNGALDLDGDLETIDDQYYVFEVFTSTDTANRTWDMLQVDLVWDPNATIYGDEMNLQSWMGLNTFTWTYDWSRVHYWYHAETVELLSSAEFAAVKDTILTADGRARPGYWDIADLAKNTTYADYLAEAEAQGWQWVESNTETWTWISFGMNQDYGIDYENETVTNWIDINMHYEFCGLLIWEDTQYPNDLMDVNLVNPGSGELTHYFMPDSVGDVEFDTPGPGSSGEMRVELDAEVSWGVTFLDINGTTYPYTSTGYWGWYEGIRAKNDLRTFNQRPVKVSIDEIEFTVNFQGHVDESGENPNNYIEMKVDNYIGNWNTTMLGGPKVLENRSLALNYLADVTVAEYAFLADGTPTTGSSAESAEHFQFETEEESFAEMIMGGTTYDWSKDTSDSYDVLSQTTPIGTFETAFESEAGVSATPWNFTESMFYVTIGFKDWDGFSVYQDPVFVSYVSRIGTDAVQFGIVEVETAAPAEGLPVVIGADIYPEVEIDSVELNYSIDGVTWETADMTQVGTYRWSGEIPSFPEGTEVFYNVVVHTTDYGDYISLSGSYIVGPAAATTTTTTTTTTTSTTTEPPPGEIPLDLLIMVGSVSIMVLILVVLAARRKRR